MAAKKRKKKKGPKLSPQEIKLRAEQRRFRSRIRYVFSTSHFETISTRGKQFRFMGKDGEFDFLFIYDNILVLVEDTCSKYPKDHLNGKQHLYQLIINNSAAFIKFLEETFPDFKNKNIRGHSYQDFNVLIAYASLHRIEDTHKSPFSFVHFIEDRHLQYFYSLAQTVGHSVRFELFKFLELQSSDVGISIGNEKSDYAAFVLPESPSGFPPGYKIVTFYADPATLISLAYVLRKDSWADSDRLYQRMISKKKLRNMRSFIADDGRVFINNVIVSLPGSTKVLDDKGNTKPVCEIKKTSAITLQIPRNFNSIGIIDGQHRVFAYYEGNDSYEARISQKRNKQQLLVTGIVYPSDISESSQHEFEARLFMEINDKQTRTRPDLRQAIEAIINPFSLTALSRLTISGLANDGPLCGFLEEHQFDRGKLKSSSIVSYGLRHIIKCEGEDSLFKLWKSPERDIFRSAVQAATSGQRDFVRPSLEIRDAYVSFCIKEIKSILIGYKTSLSKELWTLDKKISRALTTTAINGVVFCLRRLLEENRVPASPEQYIQAFKNLKIEFTPSKFKFKSSHWRELGDRIAEQCFNLKAQR